MMATAKLTITAMVLVLSVLAAASTVSAYDNNACMAYAGQSGLLVAEHYCEQYSRASVSDTLAVRGYYCKKVWAFWIQGIHTNYQWTMDNICSNSAAMGESPAHCKYRLDKNMALSKKINDMGREWCTKGNFFK